MFKTLGQQILEISFQVFSRSPQILKWSGLKMGTNNCHRNILEQAEWCDVSGRYYVTGHSDLEYDHANIWKHLISCQFSVLLMSKFKRQCCWCANLKETCSVLVHFLGGEIFVLLKIWFSKLSVNLIFIFLSLCSFCLPNICFQLLKLVHLVLVIIVHLFPYCSSLESVLLISCTVNCDFA